MVNTITVSGRVVRDPELRALPSGDSVLNNAVATEHYRKDAENETSFIDFKVYGAFADLVASKIKKGDLVTVSGYIKQEKWETSEGNRSKLVIVAVAVEGEFKFRGRGESPEGFATQEQQEAASQGDDIPF
jgi:single-strand DNA-binding protein